MKKINQLLDNEAQKHAASAKTSPTAAGPTEQRQRPAASEAHIDAISQVFTLFRINYHNQFYAAFPTEETLNVARKLWLESLSQLEPSVILNGAKNLIEHSEYLPTLHSMLDSCHQIAHGLPSARTAYMEACNAPSPKTNARWSHPIIYLAGRATGWYFLQTEPEKTTFPIFKYHYNLLCERLHNGEQLAGPQPIAIEQKTPEPLSKKEQRQRLSALKESLAL